MNVSGCFNEEGSPFMRVREGRQMRATNTSGLNLPTRIPAAQEPARPRLDPAPLNRLLEGWMQGDPAEQRETFETPRKSFDEDRPVGHMLFP